MTNTESIQTDFKDWLTHPTTKIFIEILEKQKEIFLDYANSSSFNSYHKKEISDQAVTAYGKADGILTILSLLEGCKDKEAGEDTIKGVFEQVFGGDDE